MTGAAISFGIAAAGAFVVGVLAARDGHLRRSARWLIVASVQAALAVLLLAGAR